MVGGKLVTEWLLGESLKWQNPACSCNGQMAEVLSAPVVMPSVSAAQSAYATISHLGFLTTKSYQQR